jgi:DNA-binding GntR family transcriptional regulator
MPASSITKLDRHQLKDEAYEAIREAIISFEFKPGDRIDQKKLSKRFGTSLSPVRDALIRLEQEGLVEVIPFSGTYVKQLTLNDIREIYEIRMLLEGACARQACLNLTEQEIDEVQTAITAAEEAGARGDLESAQAMLVRFDDAIVDAAENGRIRSMLAAIRYQSHRISSVSTRLESRLSTSCAQHRGVLEAIRMRDPNLAALRMEEHVCSVWEDLNSEQGLEKLRAFGVVGEDEQIVESL